MQQHDGTAARLAPLAPRGRSSAGKRDLSLGQHLDIFYRTTCSPRANLPNCFDPGRRPFRRLRPARRWRRSGQAHPAPRGVDQSHVAPPAADERSSDGRFRRDSARGRLGLERPDQLVLVPGARVEIAEPDAFAQVDDAVADVRLGDARCVQSQLEARDPRFEQRLLLASSEVVGTRARIRVRGERETGGGRRSPACRLSSDGPALSSNRRSPAGVIIICFIGPPSASGRTVLVRCCSHQAASSRPACHRVDTPFPKPGSCDTEMGSRAHGQVVLEQRHLRPCAGRSCAG